MFKTEFNDINVATTTNNIPTEWSFKIEDLIDIQDKLKRIGTQKIAIVLQDDCESFFRNELSCEEVVHKNTFWITSFQWIPIFPSDDFKRGAVISWLLFNLNLRRKIWEAFEKWRFDKVISIHKNDNWKIVMEEFSREDAYKKTPNLIK